MCRQLILSEKRWHLFAWVLVLALADSFGSRAEGAELRLVSIEPTVLLVRRNEGLLQVASVVVENAAAPVEGDVEVKIGSAEIRTALGRVGAGKATFQVHVPEIAAPAPAEFVLEADGRVHDRRKMAWQPQRRWEVCLVPISHHDLGYTDTIENVLRNYCRFYDDVLRFCDETADWPDEAKFRYAVEQTWSIQHFVENRPKEVVEKLARYVREGRIEIPALFGNEITGLCSHEELIRLMYPSFRLKRQLGAPIRTASITDIPGLSWGLPTVLGGAGVNCFFAGLPDYFDWGGPPRRVHGFWDERAVLRHGRPDAFRWEGPDGKSVLVYYSGSYGFWPGARPTPSSCEQVLNDLPPALSAMEKQGCPFSVVRYGVAGCGDNTPPDIAVSRVAKQWNARWSSPRLIVATNSMFFERLQKQCQDVRVFRGELPHTDYVVGAAATPEETAVNRLTHDLLPSAEKFAAVASILADADYPAEAIRQAYDNMLLYDEHTWGMSHQCGRLQDWDWSDKSRYAYKAAGLAQSVLNAGLQAVVRRISRKEDGSHVVVFNPLSFDRTDVVRLANFGVQGDFDLVDQQTGATIPHQVVEIDSPQAPLPYAAPRFARGQFNRPERFELVFVAEKVPSVGYKTYRIVPRPSAAVLPSSVVVGETTLENRFFKVRIDPRTGGVASIYDKELSRELVDPESPHRVNQLVARWAHTQQAETAKPAGCRKGQRGPVYGSLVTSGQAAGCPQLTQEVILYDKIKRIDLANRVLKDSTPLVELYFAFPFKIDKPDFRFEGSLSVIKPLADQFPGSNSNYYTVQHWADVSDGQAGVTLSAVESHLMEFGGLWPCYVSQAHHGVTRPGFGRPFVRPEEMNRGHVYAFVLDSNFRTNFPPLRQGDLLFRYAIGSHKGTWRDAAARDFGWAVANPLVAVTADGKNDGPLGISASFCGVDRPNVFVLALKRAEDGEGLIARLIETEGKEVAATLKLPGCTLARAYRTNLVEENLSELAFTPHEVAVPVKAFEPVTIRLHLR